MDDKPSKLLLKDIESFRTYNKSKQIVFITTGLIDASDIYAMVCTY